MKGHDMSGKSLSPSLSLQKVVRFVSLSLLLGIPMFGIILIDSLWVV